MFVSDAAYDKFMGRYSTRLAPVFADFAGIESGQRVLDVGAGTGALTGELLRRGAETSAADPSPQFVDALHRRFPDLDARVAGAEEMPWEDASFDAALAQLVVSFMSDAPAGIAEMHRLVRPGGVVAACMWDREGMEMLAAIDRTRAALGSERGSDLVYRTRDEIAGLFGAGAEVELLTVEGDYADFEDFWAALLGGAGPAGAWATSLDDEQRVAARAELFRQLGEPEGPFAVVGRAWAVRSTRA
ncbi:MAG TPA: class I SAM-dependent methyltransferase [Gaiellaceae bacterium]|nr:class I SAM-dependent methyltransferase [Gaiellaceae bacterium]